MMFQSQSWQQNNITCHTWDISFLSSSYHCSHFLPVSVAHGHWTTTPSNPHVDVLWMVWGFSCALYCKHGDGWNQMIPLERKHEDSRDKEDRVGNSFGCGVLKSCFTACASYIPKQKPGVGCNWLSCLCLIVISFFRNLLGMKCAVTTNNAWSTKHQVKSYILYNFWDLCRSWWKCYKTKLDSDL